MSRSGELSSHKLGVVCGVHGGGNDGTANTDTTTKDRRKVSHEQENMITCEGLQEKARVRV